MKKSLVIASVTLSLFTACVPAKKYKDLVERERICNEELEQFKNRALINEGKATELESKNGVLSKELASLVADTTRLGNEYRELQAQYDKIVNRVETLENAFDKYRLTGERQTAMLQADLDSKGLELQRKQDELNSLENELKKVN